MLFCGDSIITKIKCFCIFIWTTVLVVNLKNGETQSILFKLAKRIFESLNITYLFLIFFCSFTRSKTVVPYFPQCRTLPCFTPQVLPTPGYPLCCHTTQTKFCSLQILQTVLRNFKLSRKLPSGFRNNTGSFRVYIISPVFQQHFLPN